MADLVSSAPAYIALLVAGGGGYLPTDCCGIFPAAAFVPVSALCGLVLYECELVGR